jgi:hypothetical protein
VSFATSTDASGIADAVTIVVEDASGNAIAGLANSAFVLSLSGGTSTGTFGTVSETGTPGTYVDPFTGVIAGTATTLLLKVNGVQLINQPTVTVMPGAVSSVKSTVSFASSTVTSGANDTATIVLQDSAGNSITGLASSAFSFSLSGGTSTGGFGTVTETATPDTYTVPFTGANAGTASALSLRVSGVQLNTEPKVTVKAGAVSGSTSTVSFASSTDASGKTDLVTIGVEDAAGNAIGGLARTAFVLGLTGGTSTGTLGTVAATTTPGIYTVTFTGVIAGTPSTLSVKVNGVTIDTQPTVQVTSGVVADGKSKLTVAKATVASGTTDAVTIVVMDPARNAIAGLPGSAFAFTLVGGTSTGTFGTVTETSTPGTYTVLLTGARAGTASTLSVKINGTLLLTQPKVTVKAVP